MMMAPVTASSTASNDIQQSQQQQQQQLQQLQPQPMVIDDDLEQFIRDDSDLSTLEGAAVQSRLPDDEMTPIEINIFDDIAENRRLMRTFLHIRNSILKFWLCNPKQQLLLENVIQRIEPQFTSDRLLISRIFNYLERFCYINFGVFQVIKPLQMVAMKKIGIIGAGIAGLIAARQLKYFGFDVIVFEGRNRIGGRIWTYDQKADVGAFVITGLIGNPIRVLAKQIDLEMLPINQKCPLYLKNSVVDKLKDEVLENVFNSILESTSYMVREKYLPLSFDAKNERPLSLGDGLSIIIELNERKIRQEYLNHLNDIYFCQETLSKNLDILIELEKTIAELYEKHRESIQSKQSRNPKQEYAFRVNRYDLNRSIELYKTTKEKCETLRKRLNELENKTKTMPKEYLSTNDRRILDWHFANLEFATGTSLNNLSLQHWDLDDHYAFAGPQMYAKNGQNQLVNSLANSDDLDIKLSHMVQTIQVTPNGVDIKTIINDNNNNNNNGQCTKPLKKSSMATYTVDAVLCTLPLGVLKNSISNNQSSMNSVQFIPPLPSQKCHAINTLGFGNLNKVVMVFERIFWDINTHLFGNVSTTIKNRGELFLFTSVDRQQPVLVAFIAGEAANNFERIDDEQIKDKCIQILAEMFGKQLPPLKNYFITRWNMDQFSQGSYSYVARGSNGDEFDKLAEPIIVPMYGQQPKIYFAGEHTIRNYPSTVHGALLSGLREATRIADDYLGQQTYLNKK